MANENTYPRVTLTGKVSKRASTWTDKDAENPFSRTSFAITLPKVTRTSERDGSDYEASDVHQLSIMVNDSPATVELLSIVSDLDIGDNVEVEVGLAARKGFPNLRVLAVRNAAQ